MQSLKARLAVFALMGAVLAGCQSGMGSMASTTRNWWPWSKKSETPETGLASTTPPYPSQQAQPDMTGTGGYGPPTGGSPYQYGAAAAPAGYQAAPQAGYAATPPSEYGGTGLYEGSQPHGYQAPPPAGQSPGADVYGGNVALQNQYQNPNYARQTAPAYDYNAQAQPAAPAYDPSAGYASHPEAHMADNRYNAAPAGGSYDPAVAGGYAPPNQYPTVPSEPAAAAPGGPQPQSWEASVPSAAPPANNGYNGYVDPNSGLQPGQNGYQPANNGFQPGQTGYQPGNNGFQPAGTPAYQSTAPPYNPYPTTPTGRGDAPYRPGNTSDYRPAAGAGLKAPTPSQNYGAAPSGVAPASYEAAATPAATTVTEPAAAAPATP